MQQRSLQSSDLKGYLARHGINVTRWPLQKWSVAALVLVARHYHPALAIAHDRWLKARAAARTAAAYPNPSVSLTPLYTTNAAASISRWSVELATAVPLVTAGKHGDRVAEARAKAEAARYDFLQVEWTTDARVKRIWLDLVTARRRHLLLAARVHDTRALLVADTAAVKAGQSPPFKAFSARQAWNEARKAATVGRAATMRAQQALANAIGIPGARLAKTRISAAGWTSKPSPLPSEPRLQSFVLTERADVRAAVLRYAASQSRLKLAIARQYPSINIGPGYRWDQGAHRWSLGLSLTLPVFNQNQGPIAEARAQRALRAAKLRALQLGLIGHLRDALTAYHSAQKTLDLAQQRVRESQKRTRDDYTALINGQVARTTWLHDRLALAQSQLDAVDARSQLLRARLRIAMLIQHPLQPNKAEHSEQHRVASSSRAPLSTHRERFP